jgi:hypothetical protein
MRRAHHAWKSRARVHVKRDHQIEAQEREVSQIVLRQLFAAQMRMHAAQAAKTVCRDARAFQIRQLNSPRIADDDIFDVAFAVNQRADLSPRLKRKLRQLSRKLRRHNLVRRDAARVELFDAAQLIRL